MKKLAALLMLSVLMMASCKNDKKPTNTTPETTDESVTIQALTDLEKEKYVAKGMAIAKASFVGLSSQLKMAMADGGPQNATQFCNTQASIIVDSLMKAHNATIRRTSQKLRNVNNKPTEVESAQLVAYHQQIADSQAVKPVVMPLEGNKVQFYAPIKMAGLCTVCHGVVGKNLKEADADFIKNLYPDDLATGYHEGDFRGIWSIQFDK